MYWPVINKLPWSLVVQNILNYHCRHYSSLNLLLVSHMDAFIFIYINTIGTCPRCNNKGAQNWGFFLLQEQITVAIKIRKKISPSGSSIFWPTSGFFVWHSLAEIVFSRFKHLFPSQTEENHKNKDKIHIKNGLQAFRCFS